MRLATLTGVAALLTAALFAAASAGTATSGLFGVVSKGPITPICRLGVPCDAPAHVVLTFSRLSTSPSAARSERVRSTSDRYGRYRVALASGYYTVTTGLTKTTSRPIKPRAVHVRAGHWDKVSFLIDTGIR
jgi:hypothetical protein